MPGATSRPVKRKAEAPAGKRPWQLYRPGGGFKRDIDQAVWFSRNEMRRSHHNRHTPRKHPGSGWQNPVMHKGERDGSAARLVVMA